MINEILEKFKEKPYLVDMGKGTLSKILNADAEEISIARKILREGFRVLVIGDIHLPYEHPEYLEFCKSIYHKHNCNLVVLTGDVVDAHATSRHPVIPDAYGAGDELQYSIDKLKFWHDAFPYAKVCIGNHDARMNRAASDAKIPVKWIKEYKEVLEVPTWEFADEFIFDDIIYLHGMGTSGMSAAIKRALYAGKSVCMGHLHSESSVIYQRTSGRNIFGMIVGCGVDMKSYAMMYAKNNPKQSILSCGVIINQKPIIEVM